MQSRTVRPVARGVLAAGTGAAAALVLSMSIVNVPLSPTDAELSSWWSRTGNQVAALASAFLLVAAGVLALVVLHALHAAMAGRSDVAGAAFVRDLGLVHVAALVTAAAARGAIGRAALQRDEPLPDADVLRYVPQLASSALGVVAMGTAAALIGYVAYAGLRHRSPARWLGVVSALAALGIAVVVVLGAGELGVPVLAIWLVAAAFQASGFEV